MRTGARRRCRGRYARTLLTSAGARRENPAASAPEAAASQAGGRVDRMSRWSEIALIGAPIGAGAGTAGCAMGPAALRTVNLAATLAELGHRIVDRGDVGVTSGAGDRGAPPANPRARNLPEVAAMARAVSAETLDALQSGQFPIVLGGDHSLSMGSVSAVARHCADVGRELFVLWLDAHADFNTPQTSASGNMHGMPLAMLAGEPGLEAVLDEAPRALVKPANIHLFGVRSMDRDERKLLAARGVHVDDMRRMDEFGVAHLLEQILRKVARRDGALHVSLDVDFLDPSIAPAAGTTVSGGATYREAHLIMEMLYDSGCVASLDLAELNPILDERGRTAHALVELAASLFGRKIIDRPSAGRQP
jgi:arginase